VFDVLHDDVDDVVIGQMVISSQTALLVSNVMFPSIA